MNPLVTCILLAYNHEQFIESAIKGLLEQDYDNIEFIMSDDSSSDNTYEIICAATESQLSTKNIIINKNEKNLGLVKHFNKLVNMANGDIIVVAAGDDISLKSRVSNTVDIFSKNKDVTFVSFNDNVIDTDGNIISSGNRVDYDGVRKFDLQDFISGKKSIPFSGASRAFRKKLYDTFGDLNPNSITEDTPYIIRGLIMGKTAISSDIGICYRKHDSNLSHTIPSMNVDCISQQYIIDCNLAKANNLISVKNEKKLLKWIEVNRNRRKVLNGLRLSDSKLTYFIRHILPSSSVTPRKKISILKRAVLEMII